MRSKNLFQRKSAVQPMREKKCQFSSPKKKCASKKSTCLVNYTQFRMCAKIFTSWALSSRKTCWKVENCMQKVLTLCKYRRIFTENLHYYYISLGKNCIIALLQQSHNFLIKNINTGCERSLILQQFFEGHFRNMTDVLSSNTCVSK